MSRGQESENDDRDDARTGASKTGRSGLVTSIGIVAIVLGTLGLVCGGCGAVVAGCLGGGWFQDIMKKAGEDPNVAKAFKDDPNIAKAFKEVERAQSFMWFKVGGAVVDFLLGAVLLVGGILVLRRLNISRFVIVAMAACLFLAQLIYVGLGAALGAINVQEGVVGGLVIIVWLAFAGFSCMLLMPKYAKEFTR
jgi:hypothetical protein